MNPNANYTMTGYEKYINSGWLLPEGQERVFPGSGNAFTVQEPMIIFVSYIHGRSEE
jgi:hypothetical protein